MNRIKYMMRIAGVCSVLTAGASTLQAQGVSLEWARQMNSNADNSMGMAITNDAAGYVYVTGRFGGTVDFDPGPNTVNLVADGITDIFVTKMDAAGNLIWARKMGSPTTEIDQGTSIAVDAQGNVYVTGIFGGNADMDPGTGTSYITYMGGWSDVFMLKLDASGNFVWAKAIGGADADAASSLLLDGAGHILLAGSFGSTVDFDPGSASFNMTAAHPAGFVAKYDTTGNFIWAKQISGAGSYLTGNLALAPSGNMYLMGSVLDNTVDLNPGAGTFNLTPLGFIDACVLKLDTAGNFVWAKQMGGVWSLSFGIKVAIDQQENVLTTGVYAGSIDFDPGAGSLDLTSVGSEEVFFQKLDSAGNFIWAKSSAGAGSSVAETYTFTVDTKGNVYAGGFFNGTVDFNPGTAVANQTAATTDAFMMKLDSAGNYKWAKQIGGSGTSLARGISVDASGNVYSTGNFKDTCNFDPNGGLSNMISITGKDAVYVHKMVCSDTSSSLMVKKSGCEGFLFNGVTYTETGVYHIVMPNQDGCDSTIVLDLEVDSFVVSITATGFVLNAAQPYTTYQWLLNGSAINGATSASYTVTQNGLYRLVATNAAGCMDTSNALNITNYTGIDEPGSIVSQIDIYPNPATDMVSIAAPIAVNLAVCDVAGKIILHEKNAKSISVKQLATGIYLLRITDKNGHYLKTEKLVKKN